MSTPEDEWRALAPETRTAQRDMSVRYDKRTIAWYLALTLVLACFFIAALVTAGVGTLEFGAICVGLAFVLYMAVTQIRLLTRWAMPGRPVLELDASGLRFVSISYHLPWALLTEIRLTQTRSASFGRRPTTVIAFIANDPAAAPGVLAVSSRRGKALERSQRMYGTPLSIADKALDHSAGQIAAAAAAFTPVPIRRIGQG